MKRTVISVDGLAGTGKTTLSRMLAERLGYIHFSTGMVYRAVGYLALKHQADTSDGPALAELIKQHDIQIRQGQDGHAELVIDGTARQTELYNPEVSEATSQSAAHKEVRQALVEVQREAFPGCDLVVEGRDMGTVIFTDAQVKFFVTCDEQVKVDRRLRQMQQELQVSDPQELKILKDKMKIEIHERDQRDEQRSLAPTVPAEGAIGIDNSAETLTEVVQIMYDSAISGGAKP